MNVTNIGLALLLAVSSNSATSRPFYVINVKPVGNRRLDVTPHDVMTHSSLVKCSMTCRLTSWCVSANLSPDHSTCELLSEEVSNLTSLQLAEGWSYLREYIKQILKKTKNTFEGHFSRASDLRGN